MAVINPSKLYVKGNMIPTSLIILIHSDELRLPELVSNELFFEKANIGCPLVCL